MLLDTRASKNYLSLDIVREFESTNLILNKTDCNLIITTAFGTEARCGLSVEIQISFENKKKEKITKNAIFCIITSNIM